MLRIMLEAVAVRGSVVPDCFFVLFCDHNPVLLGEAALLGSLSPAIVWGQVVAYPWEKLSDLRQAIYPEGFYTVRPLLPSVVLLF